MDAGGSTRGPGAGLDESLASHGRAPLTSSARFPAAQGAPRSRTGRARSELFRAETGAWTRPCAYDTGVERSRPIAAGLFSRFQMDRGRRREEAAARREIARRLILIRDARLSWRLGYSKLSDYVVESLGISPRGAQELMRTETALGGLPQTELAHDRGEIGSEHLRLLTRALTRGTEAEWVDAAKGLTVRGLALRFAARGGGTDLHGGGSVELEAEPTQPVEFDAPAYIKTFWRESVSFARTLGARRLTQGECLEDVLAEFANTREPVHSTARRGRSCGSQGRQAPAGRDVGASARFCATGRSARSP